MRLNRKFIIPVLFLLGTLLLFRFAIFVGYVPTESMEPTLPKGSIIVGSRIYWDLKVGDVIVFKHAGKLLVKRIAATRGDVVEHKGNVLIVPEREFYVLGDNRNNSTDSRSWEKPFVKEYDVLAVLVVDRNASE